MRKDAFFTLRVLSGRWRLTVLEKESILEAVLKETQSKEKKNPWEFFQLSPVVIRVASLTLLVLLLIPVAVLFLRTPDKDQFCAKGNAPVSSFSINCIGPDGQNTCRVGHKLAFRLRPSTDKPYFSAFSRHIKTDLVIWYFPASEDDKSSLLLNTGQDGVLSDGIKIGKEHEPGRYELFGLFTDEPLNRGEIRALFHGNFETRNNSHLISKVLFNVES